MNKVKNKKKQKKKTQENNFKQFIITTRDRKDELIRFIIQLSSNIMWAFSDYCYGRKIDS